MRLIRECASGSSSSTDISSKRRCSSVATSLAKPSSIASGRSVVSRVTSTGLPKDGASSWIPPESVTTKRLDRPPDIGVSMHRKNDADIRPRGDARQRAANPLEPAVEAFAAMTSHQDQTFRGEMRRQNRLEPRAQLWLAVQQGRDPQQSVDPGIAGYQDPLAADPFSKQIGAGTRRRSQVEVGDAGDEPAVHLLGPRRINIVRA